MALIDLRGIDHSYDLGGRAVPVLRNVDLSIERGEMVAILGPSGSGKSTLLSILGCYLRPSKGTYVFDGVDVERLSDDRLADLRGQEIGFVFQQFHLLPRANVLENLFLAARYQRGRSVDSSSKDGRARELLSRVGLSEHLHHLPNQLSGGQQQRVAIARALMNDPSVILADEPTGNLDSKSAAEIMALLKEVQASGKTLIIITHNGEIADQCDRILTMRDGRLLGDGPLSAEKVSAKAKLKSAPILSGHFWEDAGTAFKNLARNRARSLLTMVGVTIGVAAVLTTLTLGRYTKSKILESYESLGVNKLTVRAYDRWNLKASEVTGPKFDGVREKQDIEPMKRLFPEIQLYSPVMQSWVQGVKFGGKSYGEARVLGVNDQYFKITNRRISLGHQFTRFHVDRKSGVCVIGSEVASRLFGKMSPLRNTIQIDGNNNARFSCRVMGVLASQKSNSEWFVPDRQVLMPQSYLKEVGDRWNTKTYEFNLQIVAGTSIEDLTNKIKQFFNLKYGRSAQVSVDSDEVLVAQMRRFLTLFMILLSGVALISLLVGGIGIANMMLVSVTERFKEIGLRKALGARDDEILNQFLMESIILCFAAGFVGLVAGFGGYHLLLFFASKLFKQVAFEWVVDWPAVVLASVCIVIVGVFSGLVPALRARRLQISEALRSE